MAPRVASMAADRAMSGSMWEGRAGMLMRGMPKGRAPSTGTSAHMQSLSGCVIASCLKNLRRDGGVPGNLEKVAYLPD